MFVRLVPSSRLRIDVHSDAVTNSQRRKLKRQTKVSAEETPMKTLLAVAFVLTAPVNFATTHANAAGAGCNEACDNSFAEEKAQEKALKDGQKWAK
jgi:hypothetical protein